MLNNEETIEYINKWFTLDSGEDYTTIDFAVSENLDENGKPQAVLQIYHKNPHNLEDEELGGVIYLKEDQLLGFIQELVSTHLKMLKLSEILEKDVGL